MDIHAKRCDLLESPRARWPSNEVTDRLREKVIGRREDNFDNEHHFWNYDDYWLEEPEGLVLMEGWDPGVNKEKEEREKLPNYHPLMEPLILEKVMAFLDVRTLRLMGRVCKLWKRTVNAKAPWAFPILLKYSTCLPALLRLNKSCKRALPLRHVHIIFHYGGEREALDVWPLYTRLGHFITTLILETAEVDEVGTNFVRVLPEFCPNLVALTLRGIFVNNPEEHGPLQPTSWFRHLTHFSMKEDWSGYGPLVGHHTNWVLASAPRLTTLIMTNFSPEAMTIVTRFLARSPEILRQLKHLELAFDSLNLKRLAGLDLRLRRLAIEIKNNNQNVSASSISSVLEATSSTLICFELRDELQRDEALQVLFSFRMPLLGYIRISGFAVSINGGPVSLLRMLPMLKHFSLQIEKDPGRADDTRFWPKLFRDKMYRPCHQYEPLLRPDLTYLRVDVYLEDGQTLRNVRNYFPALRVLKLRLDGKLLRDLIACFKDSGVEDLSLAYVETEGAGMVEFDSGLTGIPEDVCAKLFGDPSENYLNLDVRKLRVRSTLGDWKCLRRLKLRYCGRDPSVRERLDGLAMVFGLMDLSKVQFLCLEKFLVEDSFIEKLFEKLELVAFLLPNCDIRYEGDLRERIVQLQDKFPNTYFNFRPTLNS